MLMAILIAVMGKTAPQEPVQDKRLLSGLLLANAADYTA